MKKRIAMGQNPSGMKKGGMGGRKGDMMYSRGYGVGEKSKRRPTMLKDRGPRKYALGALALGYGAAKLFDKKKSSTATPGTGMGGMAAKLAEEKMKKQKDMAQGKMGGGMMMPRYKKGGEAKKKKKTMKPMTGAARITGARPNRPIHPSNPGNPNRPIRPMQKMKAGGLKPVDKNKNPGLSKLPTSVRNKMGYMKKGGSTRNTRRMNRLEELGRVDSERGKTRRGKQNLRQERKRLVRELKKR